MRYTKNWKEYQLLDTSSGERLERWGDILLIRPDPQILWKTPKLHPDWKKAHARYHRSQKGGGSWEYKRKIPENWTIRYENLSFKVSPTGFKHTGLFPEQAVNWDALQKIIREANRPVNVLNLFAYTGGASVACAKAGAKVCHVDASKGMVAWAKENATLSAIPGDRIRYIVDDCMKFVEREIRRGNTYDIIIMDPPSYGRGPGGEVWKLEDGIYDFLERTSLLLSQNPLAFLLNSYTTGLSPAVMGYLLDVTVGAMPRCKGGIISSSEIGLPVEQTGECLPAGQTAIWQRAKANK